MADKRVYLNLEAGGCSALGDDALGEVIFAIPITAIMSCC